MHSFKNHNETADEFKSIPKPAEYTKSKSLSIITKPMIESSTQKSSQNRRLERSPTGYYIKEPLHIQVSLAELVQKRKSNPKLPEKTDRHDIQQSPQTPSVLRMSTQDSPTKFQRSFSSNMSIRSINLVDKMRINTSSLLKSEISIDTITQDL